MQRAVVVVSMIILIVAAIAAISGDSAGEAVSSATPTPNRLRAALARRK